MRALAVILLIGCATTPKKEQPEFNVNDYIIEIVDTPPEPEPLCPPCEWDTTNCIRCI